MHDNQIAAADSTAVRVALWRALHLELDPAPHVFEDAIGLELAAPGQGWRNRPDMNPQATRRIRASIVARARFVDDLIAQKADEGVSQYVILGAGLDTFAQRRVEIASRLRVYEIDRPEAQAWKQQRLVELGYDVRAWLRLVRVDFEAGNSCWERLLAAGFDAGKAAVVVSTGVSMYLTRDANAAMLRQFAALAPGSTFAMTFMLPLEIVDPEDRSTAERAQKGASASGTPFISFFSPPDMLELAREAGFNETRHISAASLTQRYFAARTDGLRPSSVEELMVATS
jgi:methyltransferase (TIGR00027 family)